MRIRRRKQAHDPDETEWKWLTGAPDHNPFICFGDELCTWPPSRMRKLWERYGDEIRELWGDSPPKTLPGGHPAGDGRPFWEHQGRLRNHGGGNAD